MSRRLPASRPATRITRYVDSTTPAELTYPLHPGQLAARRREQQAMYLRWKARQERIAERDRKARRFWLGFGAILALALLAGVVFVAWFIWQALAAVSLGALAVPAVILLVAVLGFGGHRCVTVVQHWH